VINTICPPVAAKEAGFTPTRHRSALSHPGRPAGFIGEVAIPVTLDCVCPQLQCQIKLKAEATIVPVTIALFPFWFRINADYNIVHQMDSGIQQPKENAEVKSIGTDRCGPVATITVLAINTPVVFGVIFHHTVRRNVKASPRVPAVASNRALTNRLNSMIV
jgi:hypothetical protein